MTRRDKRGKKTLQLRQGARDANRVAINQAAAAANEEMQQQAARDDRNAREACFLGILRLATIRGETSSSGSHTQNPNMRKNALIGCSRAEFVSPGRTRYKTRSAGSSTYWRKGRLVYTPGPCSTYPGWSIKKQTQYCGRRHG